MDISSIAAQLRDIARQLEEGLGDGEQVEAVKRVFDGTVVPESAAPGHTAPPVQQQREQLQQHQQSDPDAPKQMPCKFCQAPIFLQKSQRTGNWYTTNSERRNDLHNCPNRQSS